MEGDSVSGDVPRPITSLTARTAGSGALVADADAREAPRSAGVGGDGDAGAFGAMLGDQSLRSTDTPPSASFRTPSRASRASEASRSPPASPRGQRTGSSGRGAPPGVSADQLLLSAARPWTTGAGAPSMSLRERYMTQAERAARARAVAAHEQEVREADAALEARREQVYASLQEQARRRQQRPALRPGGAAAQAPQRALLQASAEQASLHSATGADVDVHALVHGRTARPRRRRRMRRPVPTPRAYASWEDDASVLRAYTRGAQASLPWAPVTAAGGGLRRAAETARVPGGLPMPPEASRLQGQLRSARARERLARSLMADGILALRQHLPQELLLSTFMQRLIQERGETFLRRILARAVNGFCADAMRRWAVRCSGCKWGGGARERGAAFSLTHTHTHVYTQT